jgi:hypothetical protein
MHHRVCGINMEPQTSGTRGASSINIRAIAAIFAKF